MTMIGETEVPTPTLDRMASPDPRGRNGEACTVADHTQLVHDFLERLRDHDMAPARPMPRDLIVEMLTMADPVAGAKWLHTVADELDGFVRHTLTPAEEDRELAAFFGVDTSAMEAEKLAILAVIRDRAKAREQADASDG